MTTRSPLVDARWLPWRPAADAICVLDAPWRPASAGRDERAEFERAHIPSALFFDLVQAADPHSDLAHTFPSPGHLAGCAAAVGARRDRCILLYDCAGVAPSVRAWWMLTTYGDTDVRVFDGGLRAWHEAGLPVEQGAVPTLSEASHCRRLTCAGPTTSGCSMPSGPGTLCWTRAPPRASAAKPKPVADVRSGHIAGSRNLPYQQVLDAVKGTFAPELGLREQFELAGVRMQDPVVCSYGSGVTACVLALALHTLGHPAVAA